VYLYERSREIAIVTMACLAVWYGATTIVRNLVWRTPLSLFESMVRDSPKSVRGYSALAQYYFEHGQPQKASDAVAKGLAISNQEPNLYVVAASIAYQQRQYDVAEDFLRKALALHTFSSSAVLNFPKILFAQGKYEEARVWFEDFVSQLSPNQVKFPEHLLYATILTKLEKYSQSEFYITQNLATHREHADVKKLNAVNLYGLGKIPEALQAIDWESGTTDEKKIEMLNNF
jgi:Tfp pilus assembly protein PilF